MSEEFDIKSISDFLDAIGAEGLETDGCRCSVHALAHCDDVSNLMNCRFIEPDIENQSQPVH